MKKSKWFSNAYIGLFMCFLYLPVAVLIAYSFNANKSRGQWTGFTLDWYRQLFSNGMILNALVNTLIIALVASVVATILGTAAAIGLNNMNKWLRSTIMNFTYLPLINPEIITGVSLMLLFVSFKEHINANFELGMITLILSHITFDLPYVILNVMPKLRQMDKHVYEAALDLGCNPRQAFFKVVIPEIMPGIMAGFLMAVTFSLDDFVISYFTSGPSSQTLPIAIYSMTRRRVSPEINALSTIMFAVVLTVLLIVNINDARKEKMMRSGKRKGVSSF